MDADDGLRASDRTRLVGLDGSPDAALITKERLDHLQGAFDELSDVHTRVLVMRELEGMSYREIGAEARPHAPGRRERALPRPPPARERVRRALGGPPLRSDGGHDRAHRPGRAARQEEHRLARHARRCRSCRRRARELGIEPLSALGALRKKAAALLPMPWLLRRSGGDGGGMTDSSERRERSPAGGARCGTCGRGGAGRRGGRGAWYRSASGGPRCAGNGSVAAERSAQDTGELQRGAAGAAVTDGERGGYAGRPGSEIPVRRGAAPAVRPAPRVLPQAHSTARPRRDLQARGRATRLRASAGPLPICPRFPRPTADRSRTQCRLTSRPPNSPR